MDGTTFDKWTRLFAQRRSRRTLVKGAAAAVVAVAATGGDVSDGLAEDCIALGETCAANCCAGLYCTEDTDVCASCANQEEACTTDDQCCGYYTVGICTSGVCERCRYINEACDAERTCCGNNLNCDDTCVTCKTAGDACTADAECCNLTWTTGSCIAGSCEARCDRPCRFEGPSCCEGWYCAFLGGESLACAECAGQICDIDTDCCDGFSCVDGACEAPCADSGETCLIDADCCDGLVCVDGSCDEPAPGVPNTGAGASDGGLNLAGLAALTGAAALAGAALKARQGSCEA